MPRCKSKLTKHEEQLIFDFILHDIGVFAWRTSAGFEPMNNLEMLIRRHTHRLQPSYSS